VLLGHTRDDQAETVLLGLLRGSGTRSLAGMAPRAGLLVRPLLELTRGTTEAACAELGLTPWQDPHNVDPAFSRVRVRSRVLPALEAELGPGIAAALARTAFLAREDADLLDALAADADPGTDTLACAALTALPAAIRHRVLRRWLLARGAQDPALTHVLAVEALVLRWHGQRGTQVPGGTVTRQGGQLLWQAVGRG
jgi:tRNA(Ile)-lysidine synthase